MLTPGDRVGDYEVLAPLRSGGMARLVLGRRTGVGGFNRLVAIKEVLPSHPKYEELAQRLLDEARLGACLRHPNVVHAEAVGERDGSYYLVMEYVHGCSLGQLTTRLAEQHRRLSTDVAVHIVASVAEALHAAHEATDADGRRLHVVHRDVSPHNVLVARSGHVKLIDFGIAHHEGRLTTTQDGLVRGKLRYMAPEQLLGVGLDGRADVYSTGVVLWELLTWRRLFRTDQEVFDQAVRARLRAPSAYAPEVTAALDEVVMASISPVREERPATALAFRERLLAACPGAIHVDAPKVASLLLGAFGGELEEAWRGLRLDEASAVPGPRPAPDTIEETVRTLTEPTPGREGPAQDGEPTELDPVTAFDVPRIDLPRVETAHIDLPRSEAPPGPAASPGRFVALALALGTALVLTVGLGIAAWWLSGGDEGTEEPVADGVREGPDPGLAEARPAEDGPVPARTLEPAAPTPAPAGRDGEAAADVPPPGPAPVASSEDVPAAEPPRTGAAHEGSAADADPAPRTTDASSRARDPRRARPRPETRRRTEPTRVDGLPLIERLQ